MAAVLGAVLGAGFWLAGCGGGSEAASAPVPPSPPRIIFPAAHVDAQQHVNGFTTKTIAIPIRNEGGQALSITHIHTDCNCIRVVLPELSIPPGATGRIEVVFAPTNEVGRRRFKVVFATNDPARPAGESEITCTVLPPLEVVPAKYALPASGDGRMRRVAVHNHSPCPVKLLYATSRYAWLTVRVPAGPIAAGGEGEVVVTASEFSAGGVRRGSASVAHDLAGVGPLALAVQQGS